MPEGDPIRVLVADDDPVMRELLTGVIAGDGRYELAGAVGSAGDAIVAAARETPDVALVDVHMPGGGTAATSGILRRSPQTRVVALSAHDDRTTVLEMLQAGAVGYIVKGTSLEGITDSIEQAAAGRGSLSGEVTGEVIGELVAQLKDRQRIEQRRGQMLSRIRRAIDDEHVLTIVFQPICALDHDGAVGVEALSRFAAPPQRSPDAWFAEAADIGLGVELELLAIRRALEQMDTVPASLFVSVNASPATLMGRGFERLLRGCDAARVVIEITERAPIEDYARMNRALTRLRSLGARVAIDDAGAGFASLRHILQLEPEFIKLDHSLTAGIEQDRPQQALAAGLISFARGIGSAIIAEGIERESQMDVLASLGVEFGQGYFLARPGSLGDADVARQVGM